MSYRVARLAASLGSDDARLDDGLGGQGAAVVGSHVPSPFACPTTYIVSPAASPVSLVLVAWEQR